MRIMDSLPELSIFLLAYNEEENIKSCVEGALRIARKIASAYEVIVVLYRGSTDSTGTIVKRLMKQHRQVRLVYQECTNKGYGAALRLGIHHARYAYIFYTDADNQFNLNDVPTLLPYLDHHDIVSGYRMHRKDPGMRIVAAKVYNLLISLFFGTHFIDVDSAFKIYKKKIFQKVHLHYTTGIVDAEILIKALKHGFKIKEIPVEHHPRFHGRPVFEGGFGMVKPSVVWNLLRDMVKLRRELSKK